MTQHAVFCLTWAVKVAARRGLYIVGDRRQAACSCRPERPERTTTAAQGMHRQVTLRVLPAQPPPFLLMMLSEAICMLAYSEGEISRAIGLFLFLKNKHHQHQRDDISAEASTGLAE